MAITSGSADTALGESPFTRKTATRVMKFIERRAVLGAGERVVVAVSGGQDSTAMLLILARLAKLSGWTLSAAHYNHGLRSPEEAAEDTRFVAELCTKLSLPFAAGDGDVAERARTKRETVEEAARNLRYRFLANKAMDAAATVVAVGHTRDDRAETVLMHILRGSGLDGLAVMGGRSAWPFGSGPDVVRPLLELSRDETSRYCEESGVTPREDPTNELLIATRNRVRHEVMPVLRSINPRVDEALSRLAESAALDAGYLNEATEELWLALAHEDSGEIWFDRADLLRLDQAMSVRLIRAAAARLGGPVPGHERLDQAMSALGKAKGTIELSGGIRVLVSGGKLRVTEDASAGQ